MHTTWRRFHWQEFFRTLICQVGFDDAPSDIGILSNGDYILVGNFQNYQNNPSNFIAKIRKDDQTLDTSFDGGSSVLFNRTTTKLFIQSDDSIIISGLFTNYDGVGISGFIRLLSSGVNDSFFTVSNGFDSAPRDFTVTGHELIAVGSFTSYNSTTGNRIMRLTVPQPPVLSPVHIQSNNMLSQYADTGDTVTLSFTSDTTFTDLLLFINGENYSSNYSCSGTGPVVCSADYPITSENPATDGVIPFSIEVTSSSGVRNVHSTTDNSSVTVFRHNPTVDINYLDGDKVFRVFNIHGNCLSDIPIDVSGTGFDPVTVVCNGNEYSADVYAISNDISITISQTDPLGHNTTVGPLSLTVQVPFIQIASPVADANVNQSFTVMGTCTEIVAANVSFTSDRGNLDSTVACQAGGIFSKTFSVTTPGPIAITATQTDALGNVGTSQKNYVVVQNATGTSSKIWDFNSEEDYTYDHQNIDVVGGVAQMTARGGIGSWYDNNWALRRQITIDNTRNAITYTNNLLQLDLTSSNFNFSRAKSDGSDIRFTDSDKTTLLRYWIDSYSANTQRATIRVEIPTLSALSTKSIYIYYSNPNATNADNWSATVNTTYTRMGAVITTTGGQDDGYIHEPTVIHEGNPQILTSETSVFKMWFSSGWDHINTNYAESVDGITWTMYSGNPVVAGRVRNYVVHVGATYYMYCTTAAGTQFDLYTSSDGVRFSLDTAGVLTLGSAGSWDDGVLGNPGVYKDGNTWYMLYEAFKGGDGKWRIGLATSPDGRSWTKYGSNPVINSGTYGGPWIQKVGSTYYVWLHGTSTLNSTLPSDMYRFKSTDMINWTMDPYGPVFWRSTADEGYQTDVGGVADFSLVEYNNNVYLWYQASPNELTSAFGSKIKLAIAYGKTFADLVASSEDYQPLLQSDVQKWTKYSQNPIMSPSQAWESVLIFEPSVLYENGIFKMWYSGAGETCSVGYATSVDGRIWAKYAGNPVLGEGHGGIAGVACRNNVFKEGSTYYAITSSGTGGGGEVLMLSTSSDGISWTTNPTPILTPSGIEVGFANTYVFVENGTWYMTYEYRSSVGAFWQVGLATGPDLQHLTKVAHLTSLQRGSGIYSGSFVKKIGNLYHFWYHGHDTGILPSYIYHSTSPNMIDWTPVNDDPVMTTTNQVTWNIDQVADPYLVQANNKVYMFYDLDNNSSGTTAWIALATYNGTFDSLTQTVDTTVGSEISLFDTNVRTITTNISQPFRLVAGFTETATLGSGASLKYQLSPDSGVTWYYWDGQRWVEATEDINEANTADVINENINLFYFPLGGNMKVKAFMQTTGGQVQLDELRLTYSNVTVPNNLAAVAGDTVVALSWDAPTESSAPVTDYVVEYKDELDSSWSTFTHSVSNALTQTVTGLTNGHSYSFRVSAISADGTSDPSATISATPVANLPPVAHAGVDQTLQNPTDHLSLEGSGTDADGTIVSYHWTQIAGRNDVTIADASLAHTTVSGFLGGTYTFRLTVTDNHGATGSDDIDVLVLNGPSNGGGGGGGSVVPTSYLDNNNTPTSKPVAPAPKPQTCTPYITSMIKLGASNNGEQVKKLQMFLNKELGVTLVVDGVYKQADIVEVSAFQMKYKTEILAPWGFSEPTGIVSLTTMAKINAIVCGQKLGCPYFTEYVKGGETKSEVIKIKSFLNTLDTSFNLNTTATADKAFISAVKTFQSRYRDFVLKPWGLTSPTGYWYKTTSQKANEFMGCPVK